MTAATLATMPALIAALAAGLFGSRASRDQTQAKNNDRAPAESDLSADLVGNQGTLSWDAPAQDAASATVCKILRRRPCNGANALSNPAANAGNTGAIFQLADRCLAFGSPAEGFKKPHAPAHHNVVSTVLETAGQGEPGTDFPFPDFPSHPVLAWQPAHPSRPAHLYRRVQRATHSPGVRGRRAPEYLTPVSRPGRPSARDYLNQTMRAVTRGIFQLKAGQSA